MSAGESSALTAPAAVQPDTGGTERRAGAAPGWLVWSMIVLASLIAVGAALNTWVKRELLDTDNWVEVSDELLADEDIRTALSVYLVDQLYTNVDVAAELESRLPDSLSGLAGPISAALREPATEVVDRLLSTEQAQAAWTTANRTAHQTLVRILKDETREGVSTTEGVVTLELGILVGNLATQLGLPSSIVDRIPPEAGTIVIADSEQLENAQNAVQLVEVLSVVLFFVVLVLYAAAVYFANDRRATLRNVGLALATSGVIILVVKRVAIGRLTDAVSAGDDVRAAVNSVAVIGTGIINEIAWGGIAIGLLVALYAVLVGPTRVASAVRGWLAPLLSNWITALLTALVIVAFVSWITPGTAVQRWYAWLSFLVLIVVGVGRLRAQVRRERPDATFASAWAETKEWFDNLGSTDSPTGATPTDPVGDELVDA